MKEFVELRVNEDYAHLVFGDDEGMKLGDGLGPSVRKVVISTDDPRCEAIARTQLLLRAEFLTFLFAGWSIRRTYTRHEIEEAKAFTFQGFPRLLYAGDYSGTRYDQQHACLKCSVGEVISGDLYLRRSSIPRGNDFFRTISGEFVVTARLAQRIREEGLSGFNLRPVRHRKKKGEVVSQPEWFHYSPEPMVHAVRPTAFGDAPFDQGKNDKYQCPGHIAGFNRLSELYFGGDVPSLDISATYEHVGWRNNVWRPTRILLLSPRLRRFLIAEKVRGLTFDVAHHRPDGSPV